MLLSSILPTPAPMHIPDGFLSLTVSVVCWVLGAAGVGIALWRSGEELGERQVPLMGVLAAFIFAAQMLNFTVAGGTSGHLIGGALAAILLGPWGAILTMSTVVGIQALLFQDGGLIVMGANILNLAIIAPLVGYGIFRGVTALIRNRRWSILAAGIVASWFSVVVSAIAAAIQLAFSGTSPLGVALPAMAGVHALIAVGEALITTGALSFILAVRPDLLAESESRAKGWGWALTGLLIAVSITLFAPLASPNPDGLERVAEDQGFMAAALDAPYRLIADYVLPGVSNDAVATILAGAIGALVVAGIAFLVARARHRRSHS